MDCEILFGSLENIGVEVYIEDGILVEADANNRFEFEDTPENRMECIEDAKKTLIEWGYHQDDDGDWVKCEEDD